MDLYVTHVGLNTGKYYIGQKRLWHRNKRRPRKGETRGRIVKDQSHWEEYTSSSPLLALKIQNNPDNYKREIVHYCKSKSQMNFLEFSLIWQAIVVEKDEMCLNKMLHIRLNIDKLKEE